MKQVKSMYRAAAMGMAVFLVIGGLTACDQSTPHTHTYETSDVLPTCTTRGYTLHTCTAYEASYQTDTVPANGHRFASGICMVCQMTEPTGGTTPDTAWYTAALHASAYAIQSAAELAGLAALVNGEGGAECVDFDGKTITPGSDIDLGSYEWEPIGTRKTPFKGDFDGNGHAILNLKMTAAGTYAGLFGYTTGHVSDVSPEGVYIDLPASSYVGAVAGYAAGNITGGTVSSYVSGTDYAGGLIGMLAGGEVSGCRVHLSGVDNVGGVTGGQYAGGWVGYSDLSTSTLVVGGGTSSGAVSGATGLFDLYIPGRTGPGERR